MSFFAPPPLPDPPPERPRPVEVAVGPWSGPPANTLAAVVPLRLVLAKTDALAITVTRVEAYRSGFSFRLTVLRRMDREDSEPGRLFRRLHDPLDNQGEIRPEFLRLGLLLADGTKRTNVVSHRAWMWRTLGADTPPPERGLDLGNGHGDNRRYDMEYWAWPLPPRGTLTLVCEWPSEQVPLTSQEIDGQSLLDAAARARLLWGDEESGYGLGDQSIFVTRSATPAEPETDE